MRTLNLVNQEEAKILQAIKEKVLSQMEHLSYLTPLLEEAEAIQAKKQAKKAAPSQAAPSAEEQEYHRLERVKIWVFIDKPVSRAGFETIVPRLAVGRKIPELEARVFVPFSPSSDEIQKEIEKEQFYTFEWYIKQRRRKVLMHTGRATKNPAIPIPADFKAGKGAELIVEVKRNSDSKIIAPCSIKVRLVKHEEIEGEKKLELIADVNIQLPETRKIPLKRPGREILGALYPYKVLPPILYIGEKIHLEARASTRGISEEAARLKELINAEKGYKFEWYLEQVQGKVKKVPRIALIHRGSVTKTSGSDNPIPKDVFKKDPAKLKVEVIRVSDSVIVGLEYMDVILERSPREIVKDETEALKVIERKRFKLFSKGEQEKARRISRRSQDILKALGYETRPNLRKRMSQYGIAIQAFLSKLKRGSKDKKIIAEVEKAQALETERQEAMGEEPRLTLGGEPRGPVSPQDLDLRRSEEADRAKKEFLEGLDKSWETVLMV